MWPKNDVSFSCLAFRVSHLIQLFWVISTQWKMVLIIDLGDLMTPHITSLLCCILGTWMNLLAHRDTLLPIIILLSLIGKVELIEFILTFHLKIWKVTHSMSLSLITTWLVFIGCLTWIEAQNCGTYIPEDALNNEYTCQNIDLILNNFIYNDPLNSWEGIKMKIQSAVQACTKFCQKQIQQELVGLKSSLCLINKCIFYREQFDSDRTWLQLKVEQLKSRAWFASDKNDCELEWLQSEGKMVKSFLHSEDVHADILLHKVWNGQQFVLSPDQVLPVIHEFYAQLYDSCDNKEDSEIDQLLNKLSIPMLKGDTSSLVGKISATEVENTIKKLHPGKDPGLDGLTADFYSRFSNTLCDILAAVFNEIFEQK